MEKTIHQGRNIKRFREMLGKKQETLVQDLGGDWNQKKVSLLEGKEQIDENILEQVAAALKVPVDAIKNFDEEAAINVISNTFSSHDSSTLHAINFQPTFNPVDKLVEVLQDWIKEKNSEIEKLKKRKK